MKFKAKAIIEDIFETEMRGANNFKVRGVKLNINGLTHYSEMLGDDVMQLNNFQVNQPVICELEWKTPAQKDNSDKFWTNVNITSIELNEPTESNDTPETVQAFQAAPELDGHKENIEAQFPGKDDKPF